MEDYLEALRQICKSPAVNLTVLDSVSALVPKRIVEGDVGDATMALMARFWSSHLPEIVPHLSKNKSTLLLVNQMRNTLNMYGPQKSSSGGNALKYYNSVKIELSKKGVIKEKGKEVGVEIQLKNVKNKVGTPFITKQISVYFPNNNGKIAGIDIVSDTVDSALEEKVITQGGAYYTWQGFPLDKKGDTKIQSKENVLQFFRDNPDSLPLLKEDLLKNINNDTTNSEENSEETYAEEAA